jgi:hypothetical protein
MFRGNGADASQGTGDSGSNQWAATENSIRKQRQEAATAGGGSDRVHRRRHGHLRVVQQKVVISALLSNHRTLLLPRTLIAVSEICRWLLPL